MQLKIAAIYAGLNILILLVLAFRTIRSRQTRRIVLGDGGDADMLRTVRAHANAAEYIPAGIAGLTLMALLAPATPLWLLHAAGASLTVGRVIHALGLAAGPLNVGRMLGMILTLTSFILMGAGLIWLGFTQEF
ncbi:MAG: MAPEG family protein [Hyphomonadaceae bacterium]